MTRRTRGGATEAEESRIHEKAASQWTKEESRGGTRGGAGGGERCNCILKMQTFEYLVEVGGRAGQPRKEGQRQPSGGQTYFQ